MYVYMHTGVKRLTFLWYSCHRLRPGARQLEMTQPDFGDIKFWWNSSIFMGKFI